MCRKCTRYKTTLLPLLSFSYYHLTRIMCEIRIYLKFLNRGILDWLCHRHNTFFLRPHVRFTVPSSTLGGLVLIYSQCTNPDFNWFFS
jgi:hypothetical protein